MCWSLMSGSPKGKKEKNEEGQRGTIPLNPLEVSSARGEGAYNNRGRSNNSDCLFLCASWIRISNQSADSQYLEHRVLFAYPHSCDLCARCSRNRCTTACHVAGVGGRITASVLRAEMNRNVLSKSSFLWKLQAFNRFQTSTIVPSNKFRPFNFCLGGKVDSLSASYFAIFP